MLVEGRRSARRAAPAEAVRALATAVANTSPSPVPANADLWCGSQALVLRFMRWALCGDAEEPSKDVFLGSALALTQNRSWVWLLCWSTFCPAKTLCRLLESVLQNHFYKV